MYVCVCHAVTDRQIVEAAQNGATSVKDLKRDFGLSTACGLCVSCAKQCLKSAHQQLGTEGQTLPLFAAA
jgi:bacterioferritin-associated ferredoxin